jgi:hypothetical protein
MPEQDEVKLGKRRNIATKVFFIMAITFGLVMGLLLVGFNNFNSNRVIYLRFGSPLPTDVGEVPVTRIELTASTSGHISDDSETVVTKVYRFDLYNNATDNPRNAPTWNEASMVFNERIVTDRNLDSFTLIVYVFVNDNILQLNASLDIGFNICTVSINNLNATTQEVYYTIEEVNPLFEFISFL